MLFFPVYVIFIIKYENMAKIKLNEGELRQLIRKAINEINLNESDFKSKIVEVLIEDEYDYPFTIIAKVYENNEGVDVNDIISYDLAEINSTPDGVDYEAAIDEVKVWMSENDNLIKEKILEQEYKDNEEEDSVGHEYNPDDYYASTYHYQ